MPVTYVRFGAPFDKYHDFLPNEQVVLYDLCTELGDAHLQQRLEAILPEHGDVDRIILRASNGVTVDDLTPLAAAIFPRQPTALLMPRGKQLELRPVTGDWQDGPLTLEDLAAIELASLLEYTAAAYTETEYHYVLPSGAHAEQFIQVATLLRTPTVVHRIADWLLRYLDSQTALVADTGALLPLLYELRARAQAHYGYGPEIHVFEEYPSAIGTAQRLVQAIHARGDLRILFVLSVNSTGRLASYIREADPDATTVALFDTTPARDASLEAILHQPIKRTPATDTTTCCDASRRIAIDRRTHERIYDPEWVPVEFNTDMAERAAPFWIAVDRTDALLLHTNSTYWASPSGVRHHPLYIDIGRFLSDESVFQRCVDHLRLIQPHPQLLILPTHDAIHETIKRLVTAAFGDLPTIQAHGTVLPADCDELLRQHKHVLIADDAIVTGKTLTGLRRSVQDRLGAAAQHTKVREFVVLNRPANRYYQRSAENTFRKAEELVAAFKVYLPQCSEAACPWCAEKALLNPLLDRFTGNAREYANLRLDRLSRTFGPPVAFGSEGRLAADARTQGSYFGNLRDHVAFAAAASVIIGLQEKKLLDQGRERRYFPTTAALAFWEGALAGGILRTLRKRELHWSGEMLAIQSALDGYGGPLVGFPEEIGLAAVFDKLPREPIERFLAERPSPAVELIQQLFAMHQ